MISVDKVSQLSHRIFNTSVSEQKVSRDSNPFSQSNFQKNILTEDVFESSNKKNIAFTGVNDKIAHGTKRIYSMFVGSISNFGKRISDGVDSLKDFCNSMKNGAISAWNKVQEWGKQEVHLREDLRHGYEGLKNLLNYDMGSLINSREKQIAKMAKMDPQAEVKPMLIESIEALSKDMTMAA